jgi:PAS domain S-box-containing protein
MIAETVPRIEDLEKRIFKLECENKILREREFTILQSLPEIVFMIDVHERFIFLNNVCLEKFKYNKSDLNKTLRLKDILAPRSLFHVRRLYLRDSKKEQLHARELIGIKKDGSEFPFAVYLTKLFENGQLSGFIGVGFDLTETLEIENKLKEANLAKMKFLSIIAHDLRNPFNSLVGFSSLLILNYERYSDEKIKEYIRYMARSANQGYQLLENLLDWARANTRKIEINLTTFNLSSTVSEAINLLQANASKKEITIEQDIPEDIHVFADQNMIKTVIRNILSNSIKFTNRGGNTKISCHEKDNMAVIDFIDNGIGIAPEKLQNLFSLSSDYRVLGTEKETGTGLGLILCHEFISLNNGFISVKSTLGKGSTFTVRLPNFKVY